MQLQCKGPWTSFVMVGLCTIVAAAATNASAASESLRCGAVSQSADRCAQRTDEASCLSRLVPEVKNAVTAQGRFMQLYPVCDDDMLIGWCPCNHPSAPGFDAAWINVAAPQDQGGFAIDATSLLVPLGKPATLSAACGYSGSSATVFWDFGDGQTGSGGLLDHVFAHEGAFLVRATCTRADGQQMTSSFSLDVVPANFAMPQ